MNINTIKDYINGLNFYRYFEDIDFSSFGDLNFKNIETIDSDEQRWYVIDTDVNEISKDGEVIGYLAVEEVGMLKSESMSVSDCEVQVRAYNVKEILKKSYVIVNDQ